MRTPLSTSGATWLPCRTCGGTGGRQCGVCAGQGFTTLSKSRTRYDGSLEFYQDRSLCSGCQGQGKITCLTCKGVGSVLNVEGTPQRRSKPSTSEPSASKPAALRLIVAPQDHMVMDPTGAYTVTWNGPLQVDVSGPGGFRSPIPVADLRGRGWLRLYDLPVAVQFDGRTLLVTWLN